MMKEDKYVRNILTEIQEHQKEAPIRPDTPEDLKSSTREVIYLLNDDKEEQKTSSKHSSVLDKETESEKTMTKQNPFTNRYLDAKSASASLYNSTKKLSFSLDEDKKVSVRRNLIKDFCCKGRV